MSKTGKILTIVSLSLVLLTSGFYFANASHPCLPGESYNSCHHISDYGNVESQNESQETGAIDQEQSQDTQKDTQSANNEITPANRCAPPIEALMGRPYRDNEEAATVQYLTRECPQIINRSQCESLRYSGNYTNIRCRWIDESTTTGIQEQSQQQTQQSNQQIEISRPDIARRQGLPQLLQVLYEFLSRLINILQAR